MHDTTDNALVEISLALAMAFFALLVVALVSIATPRQGIETIERSRGAVEELGLATESGEKPLNEEAGPRILFHYRGRWFDIGGMAVNPALLTTDERRLVVALAPDLTLAEAREMQNAVRHLDPAPTLTTLTPDWIKRLEEHR